MAAVPFNNHYCAKIGTRIDLDVSYKNAQAKFNIHILIRFSIIIAA